MDYSIKEFSYEAGEFVRVINYYDIPIKKGEVLTSYVAEISEEIMQGSTVNGTGVEYLVKNQDNEELVPDVELEGTEATEAYYSISVSSNDYEKGMVMGSGSRQLGSYAKLQAIPYQDMVFEGWYEGENLLSMELEYRFRVEEDKKIVARFAEAPKEEPLPEEMPDVPSEEPLPEELPDAPSEEPDTDEIQDASSMKPIPGKTPEEREEVEETQKKNESDPENEEGLEEEEISVIESQEAIQLMEESATLVKEEQQRDETENPTWGSDNKVEPQMQEPEGKKKEHSEEVEEATAACSEEQASIEETKAQDKEVIFYVIGIVLVLLVIAGGVIGMSKKRGVDTHEK